jgi:hypothetical protein
MKKELDPAQRKKAIEKAKKIANENRLRRVKLACHGWVRDPMAVVGDWIWCEECSDTRRVSQVVE